MDLEGIVICAFAAVAVVLFTFSITLSITGVCIEPEVIIRDDSVMIYFDEHKETRPVYVNNEKVWDAKK